MFRPLPNLARCEWSGLEGTTQVRLGVTSTSSFRWVYFPFEVSVLFQSVVVGHSCSVFMQDERDVIDLLSKCGQDYTSRDSYYYKISSRRMRAKEVENNLLCGILWLLSGANHSLGDLRFQLCEVRGSKAGPPEDCLCWSSPWDDDRAGVGHDFPGIFSTCLYIGYLSVLAFESWMYCSLCSRICLVVLYTPGLTLTSTNTP